MLTSGWILLRREHLATPYVPGCNRRHNTCKAKKGILRSVSARQLWRCNRIMANLRSHSTVQSSRHDC